MKVHHRGRKSPPLARVMNKLIPVHSLPSDFFKIHLYIDGSINFICFFNTRLKRCPPICTEPGNLFHCVFQTKILFASFLFPMRATHHAHLFLLDMMTRIVPVRSTNYNVAPYAISPSSQLTSSSLIQMPSAAVISRIFSTYEFKQRMFL